MKKDKQKVLDEVWDDDRVRSFLGKRVPSQAGRPFAGDPDFYVLRHAYQSMRAEDFSRFLGFFTADGRDVRARDDKGRTLADVIARHANSGRFIELLNAH
ncbi:MAG: PA4642 family protein [Gammaproteobacteria bacterium]|nr:PA4642 family protein [Gammaproteobacteria bacterium]